MTSPAMKCIHIGTTTVQDTDERIEGMTAPHTDEVSVRMRKKAQQLDENATNAERMMALLQPEFDAFEARTGHNVYVVRDYVDHMNAAKRQRQEAKDIRELLARRAAPAADDLRAENESLRKLVEWAESIFSNCSVTSGDCCCGDTMDNHDESMNCGHVATDHGAYIAYQWMTEAAALRDAQGGA